MSKNFVVDTNLSILFVVGVTNPNYIGLHKRLREYSYEDFELLISILGRRPKLILSPNVLTETSNLARQIADPRRAEIARTLGAMVAAHTEMYVASRDVVARREYARLGLTDAALLELATRETGTICTADLGLYLAALDADVKAINFNHLRDRAMRS